LCRRGLGVEFPIRQIQAKRRQVWQCYDDNLHELIMRYNLRPPCVPHHCQQPYHMFYLVLHSLELRQALIAYLRERGILSVFHYLPLHFSTMGQQFGGKKGDCPVTKDICDRLIRLPFFNTLSESDQEFVIMNVKAGLETIL